MSSFLVIGCGYTGERVARRLLARGERVLATTHDPRGLPALARLGAEVQVLEEANERSVRNLVPSAAGDEGLRVLWSIPPLREDGGRRDLMAPLLRALAAHTERVVYLSTTSVYGEVELVDEHTVPAPRDAAGRLRVEAERAAADGPWSTLVLRPAAIYGPHRGLHAALRRGATGRVRDLDRVVSRVHVDDLAAITKAALLSGATGAFPVADDEPATTREVAAFCRQIGLPDLSPRKGGEAPTMGSRGRRVDGQAIRPLLGLELRYPSYRTGIPAALEAEGL